VRSGASRSGSCGQLDVPLSAEDLEQSTRLARWLATHEGRPDALVDRDLPRCLARRRRDPPASPADETVVQRAVREAALRAGHRKRANCRTLRHPFAAHLLKGQGPHDPGAARAPNLSTTRIYTHALKPDPLGVRCSLNRLGER
jgi:integrase